MESAKVVRKEQCPQCAKHGRDRHRDNLAIYSDGGMHCFSCGYHRSTNTIIRTKPVIKPVEFNIPVDATTALPAKALDWLNSYHMTLNDLIRNKILWSDSMQWLIFPIEINGQSIGFQARNFNTSKPYKWYTKFPKNDHIKVFGEQHTNCIVIVEDIISAIRVSSLARSMPLFGSHINDKTLAFLRKENLPVRIWLDRDKSKDAILYAGKARSLGIQASVVISPEDPKCYDKETILCYLQK